MSKVECSWCGLDLNESGIPHKGLMFCSRECRDEWDEDTLTGDEIDLDEIDEINLDSIGEDDLDEDLKFVEGDLILDEDEF